ncbi:sensor histidine kinase [Tumebacillus permanentifrigoris]|uniref:histidine kinase n=1 Tax=Tumebacillus permanentifrigoris TaxID=378543 RepID=A0A316D701_9BACL|nr:HAMP domain-containing sensor histidine kinase [Tumebacillus permanentifrigoris]PWK11236.1 phospho-acceptor domain-containing protein [Tumebacillus permanentifrigoris]
MSALGMRGLHARLTWTLIGIAAGVLALATLVMLLETHHHFGMYESQMQTSQDHDLSDLNSHVEMALVQSILWTALGALLISIVVSFFVAKRITAPLIGMRRTAERMAEGHLEARTEVAGEDEMAELGRTLNWLAEQLQAQESLRKTMTADIAHELRTPLTTLKSHMEAFEDGVWEPTPARIRACYEEIERLIHLVRDLELLTHMESPDFTLNRHPADLALVIKNAAERTHAAFLQKGVELHTQLPPRAPASIDPERITQVVVNLLSNALKFTPASGKVVVELQDRADSYELTVTDTGIGIAPSDQPYVFERFYRADKSRARSQGGGGIGLTIVKRLVEAHGGTLHLHSELGQGSTFCIRFSKQAST